MSLLLTLNLLTFLALVFLLLALNFKTLIQWIAWIWHEECREDRHTHGGNNIKGNIYKKIFETEIILSSYHFARSNSYAKFVSFEFRNNRLSIKTKARQLHKQNIFRLRVTENFQTRSESEQKS